MTAELPDDMAVVPTEDGSRTLYSARYGQTLHSSKGAAAEARWVFLDGSGVGPVLRDGGERRVLEIGFGTGLNFLVTATEAHRHAGRVRYTALDRSVPPRELLARLEHGRHLSEPRLAEALYESLDAHRTKQGWWAPIDLAGAILELFVGEAGGVDLPSAAFDAVYLDAFSPEANPELWSTDALGRWADALTPGGVLVTYSVAGAVRRGLAAHGLEVEKRPGPPGGKREMLRALKPRG